MSDDMKPCPFCGDNVINVTLTDGEVRAWCVNCQAIGPTRHFSPDGTAAGAWGDRVESAETATLRARAEAAEARAAQARAEGEAAGRAAERADVVAMLRNAADEVGGVWMADAADGIEAGEHVGAAGGAA